MRKTLLSLLMTLLTPFALTAQDEQPIITLRSSTPSFTITIGGYSEDYIDVDAGNGQEEKEIEATAVDSETGELTGSLLTFSPTNGEVKIYGNADNISYLNLNGCYLTHVDISALNKLSFLYINNNEDLDGLDLTNNKELRYLEAVDCPMTNGFTIGQKPELQIMMIAQTGNFRDFNTANYPKLRYLSCWGNPEITSIDAAKCPDLIQLSCDGTNISSLDVTKNKNLQILNIEDTRIRNIDLSKNLYLTEFYGSHDSGSLNTDINLESIDLSGNPNLVRLRISGNNFTSVDVRGKQYLRYLNVGNNLLTKIDLTGCDQLSEVILSNNYFGFSTLPLPGIYWETYDYYQHNLKSDKTYAENTVLDYASMILREGTNTTCGLFMTDETNANNVVELDESYYSFDAATGKVTLLKATTDSVFLAFANDAFPAITLTSMPLRTGKFVVKSAEDFGKDIESVTFTAKTSGEIAFRLGIAGASAQSVKQAIVDFGDGVKRDFAITTESIGQAVNITGTAQTGQKITIYTHQDDLLTALDIEGIALTDIDITKSRALRWLTLKGTELTSIDLGWNKMLERLEMSGNNFGNLKVSGANYAYNKSLLGDIFLPNNNLTSVELTDNNYCLRNIDLSGNQLTEISFKDADRLETLNISGNQLTTLDVNYSTQLTALNAANNMLVSVTLPTEHHLTTLNLEGNALDFNTLPAVTGISQYTYAPQRDVTISKQGPGVDLSYYMYDDKTTYAWTKEGTTLTSGTHYSEDGGKFVFDPSLIGSTLTCQMSNSHYPGLTINTSQFTVLGMPTNQIASFTTLESQTGTLTLRSQSDGNTICIDWNGDGSGLEYYNAGTAVATFEVQSKAGVTAKVYTYNEKSDIIVFGLSNLKLTDANMSGLTELNMLTIKNAGISSITWPDSPSLIELNLEGNNFQSLDLGTHAKDIFMLSLKSNKFETFDASAYPNLGILNLFDNKLTSINVGSSVWQLDLGRNKLTDIDLSNASDLNSLALTENKLSHIDISGNPRLAALFIDRNNFKFSTLPVEANRLGAYFTYANQADIEVAPNGTSVDIASEASIGDEATTYRWFIGKPSINEETYELVGEELYVDDEYTVNSGITYFNLNETQDGLVCAMTNASLPNLILYTLPITIDGTGTGIGDTAASQDLNVAVEGNTISATTMSNEEIKLVDISGKIIAQGRGTLRSTVPASGIYMIVTKQKGAKIAIR